MLVLCLTRGILSCVDSLSEVSCAVEFGDPLLLVLDTPCDLYLVTSVSISSWDHALDDQQSHHIILTLLARAMKGLRESKAPYVDTSTLDGCTWIH